MKTVDTTLRSECRRRSCSPHVALLVTFATLYFAIGPGNFFGVNEVMVEETAQALLLRRTLDVPPMTDTLVGRGQSYYSISAPGLPFAALPFVYVGLKLDDAFGSMNGGALAGSPLGTEEQPLRWGGRLAASTSLVFNALVGGAIVALLFMLGRRLSDDPRAALLMAVSAGVATLVMSEATHFYQHALSALMSLLGFWFFSGRDALTLERRALFGGLSLGVAVLARQNAAAAAAVLWLYGAVAGWRLAGDAPDRWRAAIRRSVLAAVGPLASVAGSLYFNYLRFGSVTRFGYASLYKRPDASFALAPVQIGKAIAGYVLSPGLSVFLFAPPLILAVVAGRRLFRRWPLETLALISASAAHLLLVSLYGSWHGDLSFGPRYMLEAIVLLMLLTLPAFELVGDFRSRLTRWAIAVTVILGVAVQFLGVAIYVTANEWHRAAYGVIANGAWVFLPKASPIVCNLQDLLGDRNLSPWALRAVAHPGSALLLFIGLIVTARVGGWRLLQYFRAPEHEVAGVFSDRLPGAILLAAMLPILAGFAIAHPVFESSDSRAFTMLSAGLAAQERGESVTAAEDYALVLGDDPDNKFARYDLGILQQDAGRFNEASALYASALRTDPAFLPARQRLALLRADRTK